MKLKSFAFIALIVFASCKDNSKTEINPAVDYSEDNLNVTTSTYPENITKIFDAHGGIDHWNTMKTLSFTMEKPDGKEVTTTDLKSRAEVIDTPNYTLGSDGNTLWLIEKDGKEYTGNAKFYKGLMFYFYAMPFIVGDNGIMYEDTKPLEFEGKSYPGILISYEAGIGTSPDDQYIIYYDAETGQMQWLGYTVTFGKDQSVDWYLYENNLPTKKRNTVEFTNVKISQETPEASMFIKPEGAKIIE